MNHQSIATEISDKLGSLLKPYQHAIERSLRQQLALLGPENRLKEACEYALLSSGKRFRPALVLMVSEGLGMESNVVPSALAIEYFHTASLIADDLPCMDDELQRRDRPALHRIYGEAVALLASYALISAGYEAIAQNTKLLQASELPFAHEASARGMTAVQEVSRCTGVLGATGGQYLDLFPPEVTEEVLCDVLYKKTVTLFEISFVTGWLFGGGDPALLPKLKHTAYHFGMAFQIVDDFGDYADDLQKGRKINTVIVLGLERAQAKFMQHMQHFTAGLKELGLETRSLLGLKEFLISLATATQ